MGPVLVPASLWASALAAVAGLALLACSSPRDLGIDPAAGGAGGSDASATGTGGDGGAGTATSTASGSGTGGGEPAGPTRVTVVHGVVDAPAIRLCFLPHPLGERAVPPPWPAAATGLPFAGSGLVDLDAGSIAEDSDVQIHLLTGDLASTASLGCLEQLSLADGPDAPVRAFPLPVLPASVFASGKSLLLVPAGCVGGPEHSHELQALVCGADYSPGAPTLTLVALGLSRQVTGGRIAMQAVHASLAATAMDVRFRPGFLETPDWPITQNLAFGAGAPVPPMTQFGTANLGNVGLAEIRTYKPGEMNPTSTVLLSEIFAHGALTEADLKDARGFAFVGIGAHPGLAAGPWWRAFTHALVRTDP